MVPSPSTNEEAAARYATTIKNLVQDRDRCRELIEEYLDPTRGFAAFSFDIAGDNPPNELTSDDLFSLNFVSVPLGPLSYRHLWAMRSKIGELLGRLDHDLHLWHIRASSETFETANELWRHLQMASGIGPTTASKIMARKRPKLIPILDRWVKKFYDFETAEYWEPLAIALSNRSLREDIDALRPPGIDTSSLSLLRILDIAIWRSQGRPAPLTETDDV